MDKNKQAVELFNKLANLYTEKYMNVELYADSLDIFCELVENNGSVLELACGPGNVTRYILEKRSDLKILGTDLAPNMLDIAREKNPNAVFMVMDCRDISKLNKTYDAVICAFGLPYLSKEEALKMISDLPKILDRHGLFYLSFMEDWNSKSGVQKGSTGDELFINYHEEGYITDALRKNGFDVINLKRKTYADADAKPVTDLVILTKSGGKPA
jgi:ubiquinone/menaquinone biosynthesis C-methylase UbiE